jgi:hypothetical protein
LLVEGKIKDIAAIEETAGVTISRPTGDLALPEEHTGDAGRRPAAEFQLAELLVPPRSPVVGRTIRQLDFRHRFHLPVLGIQRHGVSLVDRVRDVVLAPGDLLLVEGTADDLRAAHAGRELALLGAVDLPARRVRKMPLAVAIMAAVVLLAALGVMPIIVSALLGTVAMFVTGCVTPEEAYEDVDWMVLVLLGSIIPLGIALQKTGAAARRSGGVLPADQPADIGAQQQRRRGGAHAGGHRDGGGAGRFAATFRHRGDDRGIEQLRDAHRLPDQHVHFRTGRLSVQRLPAGRRPAQPADGGGRHAGDPDILPLPPVAGAAVASPNLCGRDRGSERAVLKYSA